MTRYIEETLENMLDFSEIPSILLEDKEGLGMKKEKKPPGTIRIEQKKCVDCGTDYPFKIGYGWGCQKHGRRPDKHFIDVYWSKNRYRLFADKHGNILHTYKNADNLLSNIRADIKAHKFDPTLYVQSELQKFYVSTLLDSFLEAKLNGADPIANSYRRNYQRFSKICSNHFGDFDIRDIRKRHIMEFHTYLVKTYSHLSNKSIKNILDFFHVLLNYQKDMEIVTIVPSFPKIHIQRPDIITLSQEVVQALYINIPDEHKAIFAFLLLSGVRGSEARSLKVKDVSLTTGLITVRSTFSEGVYQERRKGRASKPAIIRIHPELLPYMTNRVENNMPEAFIFINKFGEYYKDTTMRKIWYKARDATGIDKNIALKDATRHSAATNLLDAGVPIYDVSKQLGHSSVKITETYYAHRSPHKIDIEQLSLVPKDKVIQLKKAKGE